jgi:hypothetical protein
MADDRSDRQKAKDEKHARKVKANEDEVIADAKKPGASAYVQEVAEDIKMRRAGFDPNNTQN